MAAFGIQVATYANQLTILRMIFVPVIVLLLVYRHCGWALLPFVLAGLTDALDGLIARKFGQKTTLGSVLGSHEGESIVGMTITEKILAAHAGLSTVKPRDLITCTYDNTMASDVTAPLATHVLNQMGVQKVFDPRKVTLVNDHFVPAKDIGVLIHRAKAMVIGWSGLGEKAFGTRSGAAHGL